MKSILLLLFSIFLSSYSFAVTLTVDDFTACSSLPCERPDINPPSDPPGIVTDYNIFVDGNLYLDLSIATANEGDNNLFKDAEVISITAFKNITILGFDDIPPQPDSTMLQIIIDPDFDLNLTGNVLLFTSSPLTSASFEADSIYLGDYSNLNPVPIPGALWLFGSSIIGLATFSRKKVYRH